MVKIIFDRKSIREKKYRVIGESDWRDKGDLTEENFIKIVAKVFVQKQI